MNKKTLSRIAALSIAAASAVSTMGITAGAVISQPDINSPDCYVSEIWALTVTNNGTTTTTYYDSEAHAISAGSGAGTVTRDTPTRILSVGGNFSVDVNGKITTGSGTYVYRGTSYTGSSGSGSSYDGSYNYSQMYNITSGNKYATNYYWRSSSTGLAYPNEWAARQAEPNGTFTQHEIQYDSQKWSPDRKYFDVISGTYKQNGDGDSMYISTNYGYSNSYNISTSYRTSSSSTVYYYNGVYYPNYNNMVASIGFTPSAGTYSTYSRSSSEAYSTSRPYFDPTDGKYYSTTSTYRVLINSGTGYGSYTVYYSNYTQKYYDTYSAATLATPSGYTVSTIPNSYYSASTLNTYGYSPYYYNGNYYNGYYGDYYYNGYYYNGYYYNGYNWNYNTTATKDTSTVTIGKYKGWTYVIRYINASRAGASYDVNMKSETEIPSNVLKALKGKNVTLNLKFNSGAVLAVNGNDITSTDALTVNIKYDKNVPSSLAKKAVKANSGVASAQFSISGGSLGASASVTIKFSTSRSGCSAKLYRYNASANSLSLVSNSSVKSNGSCTFDNVKQGGDYVIVLS